MNHTNLFDVLVVYNDSIATSASSSNPQTDMPFSLASGHENYNDSYEYFLKICAENYLKAAFTTSSDITGPGRCSSYWIFNKEQWQKINRPCYSSLIFDKFSPVNELQEYLRETLFSNSLVKPFNSKKLFHLFFDKQKTYEFLKDFAIPSFAIESNSRESIKSAISNIHKQVKAHAQKNDFSSNFVLKDRFGAGGNEIYSVGKDHAEKAIRDVMKVNTNTSFILQPFVNFDSGYESTKYTGFSDFRIIYLGSKIIQSFIRNAKVNDFRCNVHQGGAISYITQAEIPLKIKKTAEEIMNLLAAGNALFTLDFIISNHGNVYLLEGNCGPGVNWDLLDNNDIRMTKQLIRKIVTELSQRVAINSTIGLASSFEQTKIVS